MIRILDRCRQRFAGLAACRKCPTRAFQTVLPTYNPFAGCAPDTAVVTFLLHPRGAMCAKGVHVFKTYWRRQWEKPEQPRRFRTMRELPWELPERGLPERGLSERDCQRRT